jgi:hypothetical protein
MPVEQRSGAKQLTSIVFGLVAVAVAVGIAWGLLQLASGGDGPVRLQLGDDQFNAGQASRLAAQIAADGPVPFSDVSGRGQIRPIFVNHVGDDPEVGWAAFPAVLPDAEPNCFLWWNEERELFEEREGIEDSREVGELCSDRTVGANGGDLERFEWEIDEDANLIIDVRGQQEPSEADEAD